MERLGIMETIVREAGALLLESATFTDATEKTGVKDFVTVADTKAQDILRKRLNAEFSEVVVSEEDAPEEQQAIYEPDFTGFIIDPIDGTYNFKRGMQESAISIGYIEKGQPTAGVVYDTYKDELYTASQGEGAFCNGKQIHVSGQSDLKGASVAVSNGYSDEGLARTLRRHVAIYEQTKSLPWTSCPGSAVLTMAWIACGRIDAMHHTGFKPWDNAAAFLLIQEAGGKVLSLEGEEANYSDNAVVTGTPAIVDQLVDIFQRIDPELLK